MQLNNTTEVEFCVNVSRESTSDIFGIDNGSAKRHSYVLAGLYLLFMVVGLPWNLLVIVAIVKQRLYTHPTIILLLNLTVTDFLVIIFVLPFATVTGLAGEFVFGDTDNLRCEVCRANLIISNAFFFSSLFTITSLAFDRFLFIYKPLRYKQFITAKRVILVLAIMWLASILLSLIPRIVNNNVVFSQQLLLCKWNSSRQGIIGILPVLGLLIPYVLGAACNIWVIVIAMRNIREIYKVQKIPRSTLQRSATRKILNEHIKKTRSKKQLHLTRVFGGIICSNTLTWLPIIVLGFLNLGFIAIEPQLEFVLVANILFGMQVVIHPILETTLLNDVRQPLKKLVSCQHRSPRGFDEEISISIAPKAAKSSSHKMESTSSQRKLLSLAEAGRQGRRKCCCYHVDNGRWLCGCGYLHLLDAAIVPWKSNLRQIADISDHTPTGDISDHTPTGDIHDHTLMGDIIDETP